MALYEHTVMSRQDISAQQAEALNDTIKGLIEQGGGSVAKIEYWGLRNLTYRVKKNRKAHYSLLAIDAPAAAVAEVERQLSLNEDVLRWLTVRVEELDLELSPLLARRRSASVGALSRRYIYPLPSSSNCGSPLSPNRPSSGSSCCNR